MARKKRKHQHKRIWLAPTDPDSQAWAAWQIANYSKEGEMDITMADCHRSISLSIYSKADERKLQKLIDFLTDALELSKEQRDAAR